MEGGALHPLGQTSVLGGNLAGPPGCGCHTEAAAEVAPGAVAGPVAGVLGLSPYDPRLLLCTFPSPGGTR